MPDTECINDKSKRSGPLSLVAVYSLYNLWVISLTPGLDA